MVTFTGVPKNVAALKAKPVQGVLAATKKPVPFALPQKPWSPGQPTPSPEPAKPATPAPSFFAPAAAPVAKGDPNRQFPNAPSQVKQPPFIQSTATPGSKAPQLDPSILAAMNQGSQIDPNNSLRSQQFLPGATGNQYDQQALAAMNAIQGGAVNNQYDQQASDLYGGANMSTEFSPMVGESRDMIMERLRGLSGPDRTQLAQEAYDIFQQQSEPQYQQDLRGVGQKAAALGRVGAGMTTNDLTGVLGQREQQQNLLKRSLINDAGQQTLQDRLNTLNATMGGSSTLEGQDFNRQNSAAQLAMQKAGGYANLGQNQFGREQSNAGLGLDKASMLKGMGQDEFGREKQNYQQNAQERSYQDYLARTAVEDRVRQQEMQQNQANQEWERNNAANQLAAQLAMGQNTQYPNIGQPQGDSFGAGQAAGATTPTYPGPTTYPGQDTGQAQWSPPDVFNDNPGLGMQDPRRRNFQEDPNSIFRDQKFGLM